MSEQSTSNYATVCPLYESGRVGGIIYYYAVQCPSTPVSLSSTTELPLSTGCQGSLQNCVQGYTVPKKGQVVSAADHPSAPVFYRRPEPTGLPRVPEPEGLPRVLGRGEEFVFPHRPTAHLEDAEILERSFRWVHVYGETVPPVPVKLFLIWLKHYGENGFLLGLGFQTEPVGPFAPGPLTAWRLAPCVLQLSRDDGTSFQILLYCPPYAEQQPVRGQEVNRGTLVSR